MFEDRNQPQSGQPPINPPRPGDFAAANEAARQTEQKTASQAQEPEDIFADIDTGRAPVAPSQPQASSPEPTIPPRMGMDNEPQIPRSIQPGGGGRKIVLLILILVVAILIVVGGLLVYFTFVAPQTTSTQINANTNLNTNASVNTNVNQPLADTDGDGLTDTEEAGLGTDPLDPDSDNDGLLDREEVRVYQTDPNNADTDNDSYLDGEEVTNGYDPKGPGRLFDFPLEDSEVK